MRERGKGKEFQSVGERIVPRVESGLTMAHVLVLIPYTTNKASIIFSFHGFGTFL